MTSQDCTIVNIVIVILATGYVVLGNQKAVKALLSAHHWRDIVKVGIVGITCSGDVRLVEVMDDPLLYDVDRVVGT